MIHDKVLDRLLFGSKIILERLRVKERKRGVDVVIVRSKVKTIRVRVFTKVSFVLKLKFKVNIRGFVYQLKDEGN